MAAKKSIDDPGFIALWNRLGSRGQLVERLGDIGDRRIADMDASGIDIQILSLTSPGVQVFDAPTATSLAAETNDQLKPFAAIRPGSRGSPRSRRRIRRRPSARSIAPCGRWASRG
jgi:predicted TIM-barrel fold metal-dependent hydrolase